MTPTAFHLKFTTFIRGLLVFFTTLILLPVPATAQTAWTPEVCYTRGDVPTIRGIECLVANILSVAITAIGLVVFIMFIIGSFQILLSGGDPQKVSAGKATFTYAAMGLVIAIISWFIISTLSYVLGIPDLTTFSVYFIK